MTEPATDPDTVPFPRPAAPAGDERAAELEDRIRRLEAALAERAAPAPPPTGAVLIPPAPPADPAAGGWLLGEFRLALHMYFDPHYRISRTTQFALPGILALLVFNYFFFSVWFGVTVVAPVLERLLAVFLGVVGYKILTREIARYRGVLDYLAKYGHR